MNPKIIFISHHGEQKVVEACIGDSLMQTAVDNNIDAIVADCGGACACATCHCYIDERWVNEVCELGDAEDEMLEMVENRESNSRLACQITINASMGGMIVHTPEDQI